VPAGCGLWLQAHRGCRSGEVAGSWTSQPAIGRIKNFVVAQGRVCGTGHRLFVDPGGIRLCPALQWMATAHDLVCQRSYALR